MVTPVNQIGGVLSISAAAPATYDETGYDALTWTEIGGVISIPERGDTSELIQVNDLKTGRTLKANGVLDYAEIVIPLIRDDTDAGQVIVKANKNTNTLVSIRYEDNAGKQENVTGYVANLLPSEASAETFSGTSFAFRSTTGVTDSTA